MQLKGELNATLLFEHGGRQLASTLWAALWIALWVARILLARLFRERLALGRTVKAFSKHYRKELMCSLVKIQDLVDLAKPPLGGVFSSTFVCQRWNDEMELNTGEEEQEQNTQGG